MEGHIDELSENMIAGWAHNPDQPTDTQQVCIFIAGRLVGSVLAEHFRPDLQAAGLGDGRKAFAFDPRPFIDGETEPARVAFGLTGETLLNGRKILARSRVQQMHDWDKSFDSAAPLAFALDVMERFPKENWPLITVIMPVYNTPVIILERAVNSVRSQVYPNWELCIADDCSPDVTVERRLREFAATDPRIRVVRLKQNSGISAATNAAVEMAHGTYVAYLDHDDELTPDALAEISAMLLQDPATDAVYTDQDKCDEDGRRYEPFHKPAWSPVYLLGVMYVGHLLVVRTSLVRQLGGCDSRFDKVQDFELMLRLAEATSRIRHIPRILYHWRALEGSLAASPNAKSRIDELQATAVQAHLDRRKLPLEAVPHPSLPHRLQLLPKAIRPDVQISIIIPSRDASQHIRRCLESIFNRTSYPNFEVIVVDNATTDPDALQVLQSHPIRWLKHDAPFNFSGVNNLAAKAASGDVLVFLNNDTEVLTPNWLEILLIHLQIPGVGAVGPLLLYPNGTVQHAGVVIGFRGTADHVMRGFDSSGDGYAGSLSCSREVSAVTAACLMMRRDLYVDLGGMHEAFATAYQDVDLCMRIRASGRSILYVSNAVLSHHESVSRGPRYDYVDRELFRDRWDDNLVRGDPFYNLNFTRNSHGYALR